ncbi:MULTISPECIES: MerR family transcriptional regulator [unclassified Nocardioides]|uniref:MerR family transcriptional regulator n=1 Tax=unclassified Nocardioides TaxID=2615069 RepID=UPI0009E9F190|nr:MULTISPECIES: MerR family transcriptional regulator [unclassified Nocardioides]
MFAMWMSELSERSGVPVPTVKFYLREKLLPPGVATGATRAVYDERHVERLRLIRALVDVAGMGLDRVRAVIDAVDDTKADLHDVLASAHEELSPVPSRQPSEESRELVARMIKSRRWKVTNGGRHAEALAAALDALDAAGQGLDAEALAAYADAAADVAKNEIAGMSDVSREGAATYAVIGTVLAEPVLLTLRRLAHEDLSARRFARMPRTSLGTAPVTGKRR